MHLVPLRGRERGPTACGGDGEGEGGSEGSKGEGDEDEGVTVGAIKRRLARSLSGPRDRETIRLRLSSNAHIELQDAMH